MQYLVFLMMLLLMGESHASNLFEPVANDISIQALTALFLDSCLVVGALTL